MGESRYITQLCFGLFPHLQRRIWDCPPPNITEYRQKKICFVMMRVNYTNVGIAISLLVVCFIFFRLAQRSHLLETQLRSTVESSTREKPIHNTDSKFKEVHKAIDNLKQELFESKKVKSEAERMEFVKRKFAGYKLVHLDLKGAPPKMDYLLKILPDFKKWGANGLLVEYEDMFPYKGKYKVLQAKSPYREEEIKQLLDAASENEMIVIPLVQTFGHLEFVLKLKEFSHLRETEHFTNSLCPNNKESLPMVIQLIDQVLALHPDIEWFHIGGDEVWNLKTCSVCIKDKRDKSELFIHHMMPILKHLKDKGVTPIMWDDMMRNWPVEYLKELGSFVEPMVWAYTSDLSGYFPPGMWDRYGKAFNNIWAASAFKGATYPWSNFVPVGFHVQNNLNWLDIIDNLPDSLKMTGIALTGWSRYDHYATLCELLPAALPSLAYCLQALSNGYMNEDIIKSIAEELGLPEAFQLSVNRFPEWYHPPDGNFPGHAIFKMVGQLEKGIYLARGVQNIEQGWLQERQVQSKFLSYYQVESAFNRSFMALNIFTTLRNEAQSVLSPVFNELVVQEWVKDKLDHSIHQLEKKKTEINALRKAAAANK
ncbi:hexosaminidase D-like isoform X1 [Acropora muricata]|uniref:hexosaminidase D-like isoform X1 n=1 Tax=Acropora muricata TaxID=159855 RepID=UPI0034E5C915